MTTSDSRPSFWSRVAGGLRSAVRQLAAAVYVYIAWIFTAGWFRESPVLALVAELILVFLAGMILARVIVGPLSASAFVGVFAGLLHILLGIAGVAPPEAGWLYWAELAGRLVLLSLAGLGGAWLARRTRVDPVASSQR